MWLMMLACALPLVIISFAGQGRKLSVVWIVIALGGMFFVHWVVMRFSKKANQKSTPPDAPPPKDESHRDDHPSCH